VAEHADQQVVEVVRDSAGEQAKTLELLRVQHALAKALAFLLGLALRADVEQHAHHGARAAVVRAHRHEQAAKDRGLVAVGAVARSAGMQRELVLDHLAGQRAAQRVGVTRLDRAQIVEPVHERLARLAKGAEERSVGVVHAPRAPARIEDGDRYRRILEQLLEDHAIVARTGWTSITVDRVPAHRSTIADSARASLSASSASSAAGSRPGAKRAMNSNASSGEATIALG
jgi:hypothetical protein